MIETAASLLAGFDRRHAVLFGTRDETLVTEGCFARITTPASVAGHGDAVLQRDIAQLFAQARAAGIEAPIVVGSLPFDPSKPSCLLIPERYRLVTQADSQAPAPASLVGTRTRHDHGRDAFQDAVRDVLTLLGDGAVRKVVLSRALDLDLGDAIDLPAVLAKMLAAAPTGYRFAVPAGAAETLIGVSPELLLRKRGGQIASNPLAGSIQRRRFGDEHVAARHLQRSAKDLEEHRIVVEQVREVLADYCQELDVPLQPSVLGTAFLWHLSTWIDGRLKDPTVNALTLACALHPTPAVCGFPADLARQAIERIEAFDRGLFTGMTGWMDANGDGEWAVTIRCGVLYERSARLFAGAGIVAGSAPELEWEETATKMAPMIETLGLNVSESL